MNIIVIGTGMYVSGRGTDGYGTILPAIIEWARKEVSLCKVFLVGTNGGHSREAFEKAKSLQNLTGVSLDIKTYPLGNETDPESYIKTINAIQQPACAIVAVPDHLHYKVSAACLKRGLHTLVVKPLTPTVDEAKKLIHIAGKKNLYGAVEFHKRFDKQNLMLRNIVRSGGIGSPLYCFVEYSQRKSIPTKVFKSWVNKTNILQYLGVHYIDIIRFVTGAKPVRVMATGQKNWLKGKGIDVHDAIQSMIEWQMRDGTSFNQTILVNWIDPETSSAMSDQKIKLIGTAGRFEADQKDRGITLLSDDKQIETPNPDFCSAYNLVKDNLTWQGYGIDSINTFLCDVHDIQNKKKLPKDFEGLRPTFKESLFSTAVIEAANKSISQQNNWITLKI